MLGVVCRWGRGHRGGAGVERGPSPQICPLMLRLSSFCSERPQPAPPDQHNEQQTPQLCHLLEAKLGLDDALTSCPPATALVSLSGQAHTCPGPCVVVVAGVGGWAPLGSFPGLVISFRTRGIYSTFALQSAAAPRALAPGHTNGTHGRETPPT